MRRIRVTRGVGLAMSAFVMGVALPLSAVTASAQLSPSAPWSISMLVLTAAGLPASNAHIQLLVVPHGAIPKGTPNHVIATTTAGTDGSFTIPAPTLDAWSLQQASANGGWLNLQVDANVQTPDTTHLVGSSSGSVDEVASTALSVLVAPARTGENEVGTIKMLVNPETLVADQAVGLAATEIKTGERPVMNLVNKLPCMGGNPCINGAAAPAAVASSPEPQPGPCPGGNYSPWYTVQGPVNYWEPIGELHTDDDTTATFDYGNSASTNLGVGFNFGDGNGWSVSGSLHMGNSASHDEGYNEGSFYGMEIEGQFSYYMDESDPDSSCGSQWQSMYRIRGDSWTTGLSDTLGNYVYQSDGQSNYCSVPQNQRADFNARGYSDTTNSTGWTYTWDVQAFNITLNSETDYSQQEHLHWQFGSTNEWHALFSYYDSLNGPNYLIVNASSEPTGQPTC